MRGTERRKSAQSISVAPRDRLLRPTAPSAQRLTRSVAASLRSGPRFRVGDSGFALRKTPIVRQPSSWRAVLLPPGGAPGPPGAVLARHDSGRRTPPRLKNASRSAPEWVG